MAVAEPVPSAGLREGAGQDRRRWWVLVIVACAQFMVLLDVTVVNLALPRLESGLGMGHASVAWVLDAYTLTFGGLLLLGGRVGDLLGRRRMFATGLAVFTVASLICGLSDQGLVLVLARGVQGLGAAVVSPAALSIATTSFPDERERHIALSIWGGLGGLGATAGVVLGGLVVDLAGWRWAFFINLPIGLAVLAMTWVIPRDRRDAVPRRAAPGMVRAGRLSPRGDVAEAAAVTAALLLLVYAIISGPEHGWTAPVTLGCAAGSVLAFVAYRRIAARSPAPLLPARVLRSPTLVIGSLGEILVGATELSVMYLVSMQAQRIVGLTPLQAGLGFLPIGLIAVGAALLTGPLMTRLGARRVYAAGCLIGLIGLLGFAALFGHRSYLVALLGPGLLLGVAMPVTSIVGTIVATSRTTHADAGLASGVFNSSFEIGSALGLAIAATVAASGLRGGYLAAAAFSALGLVNAGVGYRKIAPAAAGQRAVSARDAS
jgi:MFS family permease